MSRRVPNQSPDRDVSVPSAPSPAAPTRTASDLNDGQVWLLVELALRNGGEPADRCYTLFGFHPSAEDRAVIRRRVAERAAADAPWVGLVKSGAGASAPPCGGTLRGR